MTWQGKGAPTFAPSDATLRAWLVSGAIVPPAGERSRVDREQSARIFIGILAASFLAAVVTVALWSLS